MTPKTFHSVLAGLWAGGFVYLHLIGDAPAAQALVFGGTVVEVLFALKD